MKKIRPGIDPAELLAGLQRLHRLRDEHGPLVEAPGARACPRWSRPAPVTKYSNREEERPGSAPWPAGRRRPIALAHPWHAGYVRTNRTGAEPGLAQACDWTTAGAPLLPAPLTRLCLGRYDVCLPSTRRARAHRPPWRAELARVWYGRDDEPAHGLRLGRLVDLRGPQRPSTRTAMTTSATRRSSSSGIATSPSATCGSRSSRCDERARAWDRGRVRRLRAAPGGTGGPRSRARRSARQGEGASGTQSSACSASQPSARGRPGRQARAGGPPLAARQVRAAAAPASLQPGRAVARVYAPARTRLARLNGCDRIPARTREHERGG